MQLHTTSHQVVFGSLESRVASVLELGEATLHSIDFDDLYLSEAAMKALHHVGDLIVRHYRKAKQAAKASGESVRSLSMHALWVEETGDLVICAAYGDDIHCVQVPARHWTMRVGTYH